MLGSYYAMYKCQMCNALIRASDKTVELDSSQVPDLVAGVVKNQAFMNNPYLYQAPMNLVHNCCNGDFGLATFIGFKRDTTRGSKRLKLNM